MSAVLIVDDSPSDRALFRHLLTRDGFEVYEVCTGRDAMVQARQVRPHVIVLDVNLPDTDGHSVCRALRADPDCAGVPVLMLTVRDNEADVLEGLHAGADDYVAKDADAEIFLARVRRLVRYRQMATVAALNEGLVQVGRLLAGIVHEIRGPLSVIRGNAELMKLTLGDDHAAAQWVEPIIRSTRLLQARLEHLMATVRTGPPDLQTIEVAPLVNEAADLFRKGADPRAPKITVTTESAPGIPTVQGDAGRLLQVFFNLMGNAHDALQGSQGDGRIVARTFTERDDQGDWVKVEISDNGPGIPEIHLGRIFEPFFTTKDSGSGYGLYLANEILQEHGGRLTACNGDHGGACLTVWLPIAKAAAPG
jgi:signal transduction histidine kinase